jgi:hypothetical protein
MNTLRLTYSPYGFGRVLRVVQPREATDLDQEEEKNAMEIQAKESTYRHHRTDDDEL